MTYSGRQQLGAILIMLIGTLLLFVGVYIGMVNEDGLCIYWAITVPIMLLKSLAYLILFVVILLGGFIAELCPRPAHEKFWQHVEYIMDPIVDWLDREYGR